jgi:hypothetical protein
MPVQTITSSNPVVSELHQKLSGWTAVERGEVRAVHDALVSAAFRFKPFTDWLDQHGGKVEDVGQRIVYRMPNGKLEFRIAYRVPGAEQGTINLVYECLYLPDSRPGDGALIVFNARSLLSGASISAQERANLNRSWFDGIPDRLANEIEEQAFVDPETITRETRLADIGVDDDVWTAILVSLDSKLPIDFEDFDVDQVPATFGDAVDLFRSKLHPM